MPCRPDAASLRDVTTSVILRSVVGDDDPPAILREVFATPGSECPALLARIFALVVAGNDQVDGLHRS